MNVRLCVLMLCLLHVFENTAQTILSEGFEGPLTGWVNQGSVVGVQGTVNPHSGGGMVSLAVSNVLTSSDFILPSGEKHISFWLNEFNASPFGGYTIVVDLLQNGSLVKNLGSWKDVSKWTYLAADYLSSYAGTNFSLRFTVQSFINPEVRFYIDDIKIASGFSEVGVEEVPRYLQDIKIAQLVGDQKKLSISSSNMTRLENLKVFDLQGRLLFSEPGQALDLSKGHEIDLDGIHAGIYLVQIKTTEGIISRKIIF
jgi:hypothetical protein